jgi:6-phosphogluconolactonase (cycloisomerase 2 family)
MVAVHPAGKFVYVTNGSSNSVSGYTVDSAGALTPMAGSPFPAGSTPVAIAVDPTGRFAYVTDFNSADVSGYAIDGVTGALTAVPGSPFATGTQPLSASMDPTGKFLYVANTQSASISGYIIDGTTGALTPIAGSPFPAGTGPRSATVTPNGKFVVEVNFNDADVGVYAINSQNGSLTSVAGSPFPAGQFPFSIAVDRTSTFVYVDNNGLGGPGSISGYMMDGSTGVLTPVSGSPFPAGSTNAAGPSALAIDPGGHFLYATSQAENDIWVFAIDAGTGGITSISGSPFPTGPSPQSPTIANLDTDIGFAHLFGGNTFSGNQIILGSITATALVGDGSGLMNLSASNIAPGTANISINGTAASALSALDSAKLGGIAAAKYARVDVPNAFSGNQTVSGNVSIGGTTALGNGTPIVAHLSNIVNPSFPALKASTCAVASVVFNGASDGDTLALGVSNARMSGGGNIIYSAWVSATNIITIQACNVSQSPQKSAGFGGIRIDDWKH